MASNFKAYRTLVENYVNFLLEHPPAVLKLVDLFNQQGILYFGEKYVGADLDSFEGFDKEIYTKQEFINHKRTLQGFDENTPDTEILWDNEAAMDDSYRHAIFLDVTNMENPTLVEPPPGFLKDYVLTWDSVEKIPSQFTGKPVIAANMDTLENIFFPVPTGISGGRRFTKKKKQSRRKRKVGLRKKNLQG